MLFLDTYAMIEIIKGNPGYRPYLNEEFITTRLNLMELHYALLRQFDEKTADKYYSHFLPACISVSDATVKSAMKFRLAQRKEGNLISYVDCIGYCVAIENNLKMLTGEKHFSKLANVIFVK
jgi:uncharacterized protein